LHKLSLLSISLFRSTELLTHGALAFEAEDMPSKIRRRFLFFTFPNSSRFNKQYTKPFLFKTSQVVALS
jgi:hypothetical protein